MKQELYAVRGKNGNFLSIGQTPEIAQRVAKKCCIDVKQCETVKVVIQEVI